PGAAWGAADHRRRTTCLHRPDRRDDRQELDQHSTVLNPRNTRMTPISSLLSRWLPLVALAIFLPTSTAQAQEPEEADTPAPGGRVVLHPMIGVQTMWFNGDYQARRPLSPVGEEVQALGGGFLGSSNALHVEVEIL